MPKKRKTIPALIAIAVFILLEIVSARILSYRQSCQGIWLSKVGHDFMSVTWGTSQSIRRYFQLGKENEALAQENHRLLLELQLSKSGWRQSMMDSLCVDGQSVAGYTYIPAEIVKMSGNSQHNYMIINKGSEDGVKPNSGIMTSHGAIGIVDAVYKHYSYGLSFRNANVSISARLGNEGAVAPLSWDGHSSNSAILKEVPLQYEFAPGDTVWTSGWSAFFPPDIPLGVTGDSKVVNGATNNIKVTLFQDFTTLRFVTIVSNDGFDEMRSIEKEKEGLGK